MKIHYVGYFKTNDKAEQPLLDYFADLESEQGTYLEITRNQDAERFATQLLSLTLDDVDILIVGAHGHGSTDRVLRRRRANKVA
jgi:nucleotide-binding universal stress UspA family protein